jgi:hypothetical protein
MAQRAPKDAILDLLGLGSGEAEAAPWNKVVQLLQKIGPEAWAALDKPSKAAMELMTESYPSLKKSKLLTQSGPSSDWADPVLTKLSEKGRRTITTREFLAQNPSIEDWVGGSADPGSIHLGGSSSKGGHPLALSHESAHDITGPMYGWVNPPMGNQMNTSLRAGQEGFAEGMSNAMLNRFNKKAYAPYWPNNYRAAKDHQLRNAYLDSGKLGRSVGDELRSGTVPAQEDIINMLIKIIQRNR